jgi:plastocyanin
MGEGRIQLPEGAQLRRIVISIVAACALAALAAVLVSPAQAKFTGLKGEVNDNFQIKLRKNGVAVKTLKAGTYRIQIEDESTSHNFHLFGPGSVNKKTTVPFVGKRTWTVTFRAGRYTFQCDPHALSGMKGRFRVTA